MFSERELSKLIAEGDLDKIPFGHYEDGGRIIIKLEPDRIEGPQARRTMELLKSSRDKSDGYYEELNDLITTEDMNGFIYDVSPTLKEETVKPYKYLIEIWLDGMRTSLGCIETDMPQRKLRDTILHVLNGNTPEGMTTKDAVIQEVSSSGHEIEEVPVNRLTLDLRKDKGFKRPDIKAVR